MAGSGSSDRCKSHRYPGGLWIAGSKTDKLLTPTCSKQGGQGEAVKSQASAPVIALRTSDRLRRPHSRNIKGIADRATQSGELVQQTATVCGSNCFQRGRGPGEKALVLGRRCPKHLAVSGNQAAGRILESPRARVGIDGTLPRIHQDSRAVGPRPRPVLRQRVLRARPFTQHPVGGRQPAQSDPRFRASRSPQKHLGVGSGTRCRS